MLFRQGSRKARSVSFGRAALLCLLFLGGATAHGDDSQPLPSDSETVAIAAEYRRLRSGAAYSERQGELLVELSRIFRSGRYSRQAAVDLLGAPDSIARPGSVLFAFARWSRYGARGKEILIYRHVRRINDFVYLDSDGARIIGSGDWAALE